MNYNPTRARALHRARVLSAQEVAPRHHLLRLRAPELVQSAAPGQFVHVLTAPNATGFGFDPLLRRAFSIMNVADGQSDQAGSFELLFRAEGRGTNQLAGARVGDEIDLLGPLGQPFDTSMFHVKQEAAAPGAIVVGGGVGVPPLVFLSGFLSARNVKVKALVGARSRAEIIGTDALQRAGTELEVATDDGSFGHQGRVTELLQRALDAGDAKPIVYACGPWPMLRAVARVCERAAVRAQVSLEEAMPCGIGVCNGCVVRAREPFANENSGSAALARIGNEWSPYERYRRICVEGPACWAHEIEWEQPPQHDLEAQPAGNEVDRGTT